MTTPPESTRSDSAASASAGEAPDAQHSIPSLAVRSVIGGGLMGFANIVPGISGGAMLMLLGVYTRFITAVAEFTTLKFRPRSLLVLFTVGFTVVCTILALSGPVKDIIVNYTWQVYALLIGMRLGVIPMVVRLARPLSKGFYVAAGVGFMLTIGVAALRYTSTDFGAGAGSGPFMRGFACLLGGIATLLPGLDGSYILMLMGQYVPILAGVDQFKDALLGTVRGEVPFAQLWSAFLFLLPVGIGVLAGVATASLSLRHLLKKHPKPTYGVLIGVLVGAVIGLWPFQRYTQPQPGDTVLGEALTADAIAAMKPEDWPVKFFAPDAMQIAMALGLVIVGFVLATVLDRLSPDDA